MPIIDFTQPFYLIAAVVLFLLCLYLGRNNKTNTVTCVMLLSFLTILVCHTIELANCTFEYVNVLATCILIDELFVLVSFLSFLWLDKIQVEAMKANKANKKNKKDSKEKLEDKVIEDGLDVLWKKV